MVVMFIVPIGVQAKTRPVQNINVAAGEKADTYTIRIYSDSDTKTRYKIYMDTKIIDSVKKLKDEKLIAETSAGQQETVVKIRPPGKYYFAAVSVGEDDKPLLKMKKGEGYMEEPVSIEYDTSIIDAQSVQAQQDIENRTVRIAWRDIPLSDTTYTVFRATNIIDFGPNDLIPPALGIVGDNVEEYIDTEVPDGRYFYAVMTTLWNGETTPLVLGVTSLTDEVIFGRWPPLPDNWSIATQQVLIIQTNIGVEGMAIVSNYIPQPVTNVLIDRTNILISNIHIVLSNGQTNQNTIAVTNYSIQSVPLAWATNATLLNTYFSNRKWQEQHAVSNAAVALTNTSAATEQRSADNTDAGKTEKTNIHETVAVDTNLKPGSFAWFTNNFTTQEQYAFCVTKLYARNKHHDAIVFMTWLREHKELSESDDKHLELLLAYSYYHIAAYNEAFYRFMKLRKDFPETADFYMGRCMEYME